MTGELLRGLDTDSDDVDDSAVDAVEQLEEDELEEDVKKFEDLEEDVKKFEESGDAGSLSDAAGFRNSAQS